MIPTSFHLINHTMLKKVVQRTTTVRKRAPRKRLTRKARNYKAKAAVRKQLGAIKKGSDAQRNAIDSTDNAFLSTDTLYATNCISIAHGDASASRDRNEVFISGIEVQLQYKNMIDSPIQVNVAVVSPTDTPDVAVTGFFRGSGNERGKDFNTAIPFDKHMLPINTDKYHVLMHKRFLLAAIDPATNSFPDPVRPSYRTLARFIPIKRRFTFTTDSSATPAEPSVYLCTWFTIFGDTSGTPLASVTQTRRIRLLYREIN